MGGLLEAFGLEPTVRLLAHRLSWREVVGEVRPLCARAGAPQQSVQYGSNGVLPLPSVSSTQQKIRSRKKEVSSSTSLG